ncbi:uncharacterized protein Swt1 [Epargyreus clarus]|uniref:uncharacterized protein Swt1 n=1 Tax=Epargyreus clarus TaxID=520877 RepID=UPI003C2DE37C
MSSDNKEIEELSDGWVLCRSKSNPGRQYYFNRKTGKSSWTEPQPDDKQDKNSRKKEKVNQERKKREEPRSKTVKRKSDGADAETSKKKHKHETPEKSRGPPSKRETLKPKPKPAETRPQHKDLPTKRKSIGEPNVKSSPTKLNDSLKTTPKNLANNRLSQLRAQLNTETRNETDEESSPKKNKISPKHHETPVKSKTEQSPNLGESFNSTTKSPSSDSLQSIPSPSQFFAANKIICSMKAQLPEEFCNKGKPKDTFADIEQGICNQMTEYPVIKHPATPPQFSEASKLVSAIKSKLSYKLSTPKDVKTFTTAKDRMEALRASLSGEVDERDLQDEPTIKQKSPQKCEAMEVEEIKDPQSTDTGPRDMGSDDQHVVLVVDTNIFIHELDFIKNVLNSHIEGYSEQPMLLVPWRVINELDRLKDNNNGNGALCKRARAAMDYLYKSLPENNRIKGQSLRDANSHIYPCELPDDEILNCALQQAERGKNVVLLSNDRNLCSKATVNGIRRLGIAELRALLQQPVKRDPALFDTFRHCDRTVYQLLANILENEMRAKYNNLWQRVVFKAPPWRLRDVLQCLLKHWVAVFNEVFPRIEHLITELKDVYVAIEAKDPEMLTQSEVSNFKDLCLDVASRCQIIPEYMELAKLTVERLRRGASETDDRAGQTVVDAFENTWTLMSSYCAKLSTALGIPHSIEDKLPATETLANLANQFTAINGNVANFILAIKGVLDMEDTSSMDEKTVRLETAFRDALRRDPALSREHLRGFCVTNRNMLQEAVNKFSQLAQHLDICKQALPRSAD